MLLTSEQIAEIHREIDLLSDDEIERRLHANIYANPDKRKVVELYLERRHRQRHERFTAKDRNIQLWILAFAVGTFVVALLTWFFL